MSNKITTIRTDLICPQCYNITTIQRTSKQEQMYYLVKRAKRRK